MARIDCLQQSTLSHQTFLSGDPSAVAPPVPIPNTEVKRCSPDGSASIGCARVGRCQYFARHLGNKMPGISFLPGNFQRNLISLKITAGAFPARSSAFEPLVRNCFCQPCNYRVDVTKKIALSAEESVLKNARKLAATILACETRKRKKIRKELLKLIPSIKAHVGEIRWNREELYAR